MLSAPLLSAINKTLDDKKKGCASVTQLLDFSPRALANLFYCSPIISETECALLVSTDLSPSDRRRCVVAWLMQDTSLGDWIASIGKWQIKKIAPSITFGAAPKEFCNARRLPITNYVSREALTLAIEALVSAEHMPFLSDSNGEGDLLRITELVAEELATDLQPGLVQFKRAQIY